MSTRPAPRGPGTVDGPVGRWQALCMDAADPAVLAGFWGPLLGLRAEMLDDGDVVLRGARPGEDIWIDAVPEPRTVKHRVHLDVRTADRELLAAAGSRVVLPQEESGLGWTVHADPEGGEFCSFLTPELPTTPPARLYELVVAAADTAACAELARWWASLLGGEVVDDERGFSWVQDIPGCPLDSLDIVPVPEPKTAKNRIHIDVVCDDIAALVASGARVLAEPAPGRPWHVLADPQGNEFCADPRP